MRYLKTYKLSIFIFVFAILSCLCLSLVSCQYEETSSLKEPNNFEINSLKIHARNGDVLWFHPLFTEAPNGIKFYRANNTEILNWKSWEDLTEATQYSFTKPNCSFMAYTTVDCSFDYKHNQNDFCVFKNVGEERLSVAREIDDAFKNNYCINGINILPLVDKDNWNCIDEEHCIYKTPLLSGVAYSSNIKNGFFNVYQNINGALSKSAQYCYSNIVFNKNEAYYWDGHNSLWYTTDRSDNECCVLLSKNFSN